MWLPRWPVTLLVAIGLLSALWSIRAVQVNSWDTSLLESYAALFAPELASDSVLLGIDDESLEALGPWPWPRSVHADIVAALAGSETIVYDVAFIGQKQAESDQQFVTAVRQHGQVVLPLLAERNTKTLSLDTLLPFQPLPGLAVLGHIDSPLSDGVFSTFYLKAGNNNAQHPYLALAALAVSDEAIPSLPGLRQSGLRLPRNGLWARDFANIFVPSPLLGQRKIISVYDLLSGQFSAQAVAGKTVFVGPVSRQIATAVPVLGQQQSLFDVQIQQQVYESLKQGKLLQRGPNVLATLMAVACWFLAAMLLFVRTKGLVVLIALALALWLLVLPFAIAWLSGIWVLQGFGLLAAAIVLVAVGLDRLLSAKQHILLQTHQTTDDYLKTVNQAFATAPIEGVFAVMVMQPDFYLRYISEKGKRQGFRTLTAIQSQLSRSLGDYALATELYDDYSLVWCGVFSSASIAQNSLEAVAKDIEDLAIVHETSTAAAVVTISAGAAYSDLSVLDQPELLVGNAEVALKQAIAQSRNQVCVFK